MEFIFAQFSPTVCLPCKQTDLVQRIIALFKVLLYRVSSKKLLKIENTRPNQLELEFSFSFDHGKKITVVVNLSNKEQTVKYDKKISKGNILLNGDSTGIINDEKTTLNTKDLNTLKPFEYYIILSE